GGLPGLESREINIVSADWPNNAAGKPPLPAKMEDQSPAAFAPPQPSTKSGDPEPNDRRRSRSRKAESRPARGGPRHRRPPSHPGRGGVRENAGHHASRGLPGRRWP